VTGCGDDGCGPGEGNAPVSSSMRCGPAVAVSMQPAVDRMRRLAHTMGFVRERVFLVWQEQDQKSRRWREVERLELMPVRVLGLDKLNKVLSENGTIEGGEVTVHGVSPAQVTIAMLQGRRDGKAWADSSSREFFFEVERTERCEGDRPEPRLRFALAGEVAAPPLEYRFRLVAQQKPRRDDGRDAGLLQPGRLADVMITS